jgi:hypothetical protein
LDEALKINPQYADALNNNGRNDEANKTFSFQTGPGFYIEIKGFVIIFAIVGLIIIAYLLRRRG